MVLGGRVEGSVLGGWSEFVGLYYPPLLYSTRKGVCRYQGVGVGGVLEGFGWIWATSRCTTTC
jgi:hypothetical protein